MRSAPPIVPGMPRRKDRPGDAGLRCRAGDLHVGRAGAGADPVVRLDRDLGKAFAEADDHALPAAVADEQVGAEPDDQDRHLRVETGRKYARSSSSAGVNSTCAGPPVRNQDSGAVGALASSVPRRSGIRDRRPG